MYRDEQFLMEVEIDDILVQKILSFYLLPPIRQAFTPCHTGLTHHF